MEANIKTEKLNTFDLDGEGRPVINGIVFENVTGLTLNDLVGNGFGEVTITFRINSLLG